jgi:hypothetical protein
MGNSESGEEEREIHGRNLGGGKRCRFIWRMRGTNKGFERGLGRRKEKGVRLFLFGKEMALLLDE